MEKNAELNWLTDWLVGLADCSFIIIVEWEQRGVYICCINLMLFHTAYRCYAVAVQHCGLERVESGIENGKIVIRFCNAIILMSNFNVWLSCFMLSLNTSFHTFTVYLTTTGLHVSTCMCMSARKSHCRCLKHKSINRWKIKLKFSHDYFSYFICLTLRSSTAGAGLWICIGSCSFEYLCLCATKIWWQWLIIICWCEGDMRLPANSKFLRIKSNYSEFTVISITIGCEIWDWGTDGSEWKLSIYISLIFKANMTPSEKRRHGAMVILSWD